MTAATLGARGEKLAADFLRRKGIEVLEKHHRTRLGEIDLICRDRDTIVFVEVKARSCAAIAQPFESVGAHKRDKLRRLAEQYLEYKRLGPVDARFDVVSVVLEPKPAIEHIIGAF